MKSISKHLLLRTTTHRHRNTVIRIRRLQCSNTPRRQHLVLNTLEKQLAAILLGVNTRHATLRITLRRPRPLHLRGAAT